MKPIGTMPTSLSATEIETRSCFLYIWTVRHSARVASFATRWLLSARALVRQLDLISLNPFFRVTDAFYLWVNHHTRTRRRRSANNDDGWEVGDSQKTVRENCGNSNWTRFRLDGSLKSSNRWWLRRYRYSARTAETLTPRGQGHVPRGSTCKRKPRVRTGRRGFRRSQHREAPRHRRRSGRIRQQCTTTTSAQLSDTCCSKFTTTKCVLTARSPNLFKIFRFIGYRRKQLFRHNRFCQSITCNRGKGSLRTVKGSLFTSLGQQNITICQWSTANLAIMNKLLQRGVLTHSSPLDYLSYTTRVYQLLSVHDTRSVFLYDREYRKLQTLHNFRWDTDVPHLQMVHLRPKSLQNFQNNLAPKTRSNSQLYPPRVSHNAQGIEICKRFNGRKGCSVVRCRFDHTCSVPGCGQAHPAYDHAPPHQTKKPVDIKPCHGLNFAAWEEQEAHRP